MLNIANFLASGETSLFTQKGRLLRNGAAAVVLPLAIASLTGCSVNGAAPYSSANAPAEYQPHVSVLLGQVNAFAKAGAQLRSPIGDLHIASDGPAAAYGIDGNTLLLQAMLDPSAHTIKVVSSTSQFLDQFIASQSKGIKQQVINENTGVKWGDVPAQALSKALYNLAPNGVTYHAQNEADIACVVLAIGTSRHPMPGGKVSTYVDASQDLYVVSGSANDAYTAIHEAAHCYPYAPLDIGNDPISEGYKSSIREVRSDLAAVLYGASQTGSFDTGVAMVSALRSGLQNDLSHVTVELLDSILKQLNPKDYIGKPVHEVIALAVQIVHDLHPAANTELRFAYAHDAWTSFALSEYGPKSPKAPIASEAFAHFAGRPFTVDLTAYASRTIERSLDNAIYNADTVRGAHAMPLTRLADFARDLGYTPTAQQWKKAAFVDGNITPVGTRVSADGSLTVRATPFSLSGLEARLKPQIGGMLAQGVLTTARKHQVAVVPEGEQQPGTLRERFGEALGAVGRALRTEEAPASKPRGPSM